MNKSGSDPHQLDIEACLYLYQPVSIKVTCGQMTVIETGQIPGRAPIVTAGLRRVPGLPRFVWHVSNRAESHC